MSYDKLRQLITYWEQFERATGESDLASFASWLQLELRSSSAGQEAVPKRNRYGAYNGQIAHAIAALYQHARHYIKTALSELPLHSLFDFTFLAALAEQGDLRKSDLIALNLIEYSAGMEVIRRLIRRGLAEDFEDPQDARSSRVRLTPQGREVFGQALHAMQGVSQLVPGDLSEAEKVQLLTLSRRLLRFHQAIWEEDHGRPLADIQRKHLSGSEDLSDRN